MTFGTKGHPVMVFVAGFPDDQLTGWGKLVSEFSETHRVICMCWPGYEKGGANKLPRWGYLISEVVAAMHETLADISAEESIDNFTLVIHDWGSYLGLLYQNSFPERVARIVCFDVGILKKPPLKDTAIILLYQLWFCVVYFFSHFLGKIVGQAMMMSFFLFVNPFLGPAPHDRVARPQLEITPWMLYPYWQFHFGSEGYFMKGPQKMLRPRYPVSNCKILFMYGKKKRCMFHGPEFLEKIEKDEGSSWRAFDAGHWVQTSAFQPEVIAEMRRFMAGGEQSHSHAE